ncbi:unnamed protein product [Amoebophrya sp. A25]|nr:unnamed protein product [Amoebophrya sp. A25]|eukprot:GSA25T00005994001.1
MRFIVLLARRTLRAMHFSFSASVLLALAISVSLEKVMMEWYCEDAAVNADDEKATSFVEIDKEETNLMRTELDAHSIKKAIETKIESYGATC